MIKRAMDAEEKFQREGDHVLLKISLEKYCRLLQVLENHEKTKEKDRERKRKTKGNEERYRGGRNRFEPIQFPPLEVVKASSAPIEV